MKKQITIDIISDIICPWCYIGKARLERAIASFKDDLEVIITMRPFLLYPHIPVGGVEKEQFSKLKKPGLGTLLREEAAKENIVIDYRKIDRVPNTLEAHRLMYLCKEDAVKNELGKILFRMYFEEGKDVEDKTVLLAVAKEAGVKEEVIQQFETSTAGTEEVQADIAYLKEEGISAVPSFIINKEHLIVGAQPMRNFERYFSKLVAKKRE